jgi:hypothetical protein
MEKNPKKNLKKKKSKIWTIYYGCRSVSIKSGTTSHGTCFKQSSKSNIVFLETVNGTKRIVFHKGGNTKPKVMKQL